MSEPQMGQIVVHVVAVLVPMLLSLTVHEFAHGLSANMLGDDTAKSMGRLTLNPIAHIDLVGTIILPAAIVVLNASSLGVPFFGWAKPVPFNPLRFDKRIPMMRGILITAIAGPVSNLIFASICASLLAVFYHTGMLATFPKPIGIFLNVMILINLALALFNMIPVYPLDGQKVVMGLLPGELGYKFDVFSRRFGMMLLIVVIAFGGRYIGIPLMWAYIVLNYYLFQIPPETLQSLFPSF